VRLEPRMSELIRMRFPGTDKVAWMNIRKGPDECGFLECFVHETENRSELIPFLNTLGDSRSEVELLLNLLIPGDQSGAFPIYNPTGDTRRAYVAACSLRSNRVHFKLAGFLDPVLKSESERSQADSGSGVYFVVPSGGHNPAILASPSIPWKLIEGDDPPRWADVECAVRSGDVKLLLSTPHFALVGERAESASV